MDRTARLLIAACSFSLAAELCSPALAQDAAPALKGPEVKDRQVPGVSPDFGVPAEGRRRFAERSRAKVKSAGSRGSI